MSWLFVCVDLIYSYESFMLFVRLFVRSFVVKLHQELF